MDYLRRKPWLAMLVIIAATSACDSDRPSRHGNITFIPDPLLSTIPTCPGFAYPDIEYDWECTGEHRCWGDYYRQHLHYTANNINATELQAMTCAAHFSGENACGYYDRDRFGFLHVHGYTGLCGQCDPDSPDCEATCEHDPEHPEDCDSDDYET